MIHIVGGGSRNAFLNQLTANACGMKVVAGPEEATAVGNAMVAGHGAGPHQEAPRTRRSMIQSAFPIREFTPKERDTWEKAYARYRAVVK